MGKADARASGHGKTQQPPTPHNLKFTSPNFPQRKPLNKLYTSIDHFCRTHLWHNFNTLSIQLIMSANAIMEGLKRGSEAEHEFVKQLREVMCTILNRMVVECYGRGDALDELKERMRDGGHTHETTEGLLAEIQALKDEKAVLQGDIRAWQLKAAAAHRSPQQSVSRHLKFLGLIMTSWSREHLPGFRIGAKKCS